MNAAVCGEGAASTEKSEVLGGEVPLELRADTSLASSEGSALL